MPMTPTRVSITVHVDRVSLTERLKYSLKSQNPPSFTWDSIKLPDPMARTMSSGCTLVPETRGRTMPAAVRPATVAEPMLTRSMVAISHPNTKGGMLDGESNV